MAQPPSTVDANQFTIEGPIRISYSRSSISGDPLVSYKDAQVDLNFRGDKEIIRTTTEAGELVAFVTLNAVDAFLRTFTLVVPTVRLTSRSEQAEFTTLAYETTDRSLAFTLPPGPTGVLMTYRVFQLSGTAEFVVS